ncbi:phage head-binding domain-containing protein [Symbiopectobacterium purcellii]|uniref:phage head-binding domain-containing protein n=1 Tax=Symbiopectobacterium purcellii TaxID=2871826 RepID=UPI002076A12F|nr:phage head-binding domain-containing protein [Symbiopectobacterium purcellii]
MADITPNVVVSQPSQLFTLARSFKANANGKIYIGQIDTDPTIPSNQIQVYLENEDGSHVPVAQPIVINAGGYPVYNGQIAKFVTVQGHSMAIYDAYNVQQFYFPNVLKYDPDQLSTALAQEDGAGQVGTSSGVNLQEYINALYFDVIAFSESELSALFAVHNNILLRVSAITGPITIPPYKKLTIVPLVGQHIVTVKGTGTKILVSRGAELYAPNLTCTNEIMDVVSVVGSSRPSFILAVSERPKIKVNIQSEYKLGRGIVMDASTDAATNASGIISDVDIDTVIRGMGTAYEEIMTRNGTETDPTYINNNHIRIVVWQCRRGLIQQNYNHGVDEKIEASGNTYDIDYQTDANSVDVIQIYGARNIVKGNVWDFAYPGLHSQSILIKGFSNDVGSRNFPAINSGFVSVDSAITSRNNYIGSTYGTDRQDISQFSLLWRPYHLSHPDDTPITMTSNIFMFQNERVISAGTLVDVATKRVYFRSTDRLPLTLLGDVFIRNHSATAANVRIGFGISNASGNQALSETFTIPATGLIRVPLHALLTSNRLYATSGTTTWYGFPSLTAGFINFNLCITTDNPVTVAGCNLQLSKFDY